MWPPRPSVACTRLTRLARPYAVHVQVNPSGGPAGDGGARDLAASLLQVAAGEATMNDAVGPAVGCLMATFGTNMISSCIFEFDDPDDLR